VQKLYRDHHLVHVLLLGLLLGWLSPIIRYGQAQNGGEGRLTPELLWQLSRIGGAAVSPDGQQLLVSVSDYQLQENGGSTSLWLGQLPERFTAAELERQGRAVAFDTPMLELAQWRPLIQAVKGLSSAQWWPQGSGTQILYLAPGPEDGAGGTQIWLLDPREGSQRCLTDIAGGVSHLKLSPTGEHVAFTRRIKLEPTVHDLHPDLPKADAQIIDSLMYRHWDSWSDGTYSHLHLASLGADGTLGELVNVMDKLKADSPLPPFGGSEQFAFSPDGAELAFTMKLVNNPAQSTDSNLYLYNLAERRLTNLTTGMPGYDQDPVYSPDGRYLAFNSMERAGFEADRIRIMLWDRHSHQMHELTAGLDQNGAHPAWSPDGQRMYFESEQAGTRQIFMLEVAGGPPRQVSRGRFEWRLMAVLPDGRLLLGQQNSLRPTELAILEPDTGDVATLTDLNGSVIDPLQLPQVQERWITSTDGAAVHCWLFLPPDFDPQAQYPLLVYCQGGPQSQIGQWFSYRWNFHLMASQGYAVLAVNRRGLPGFGQAWNDQISGDWGGQAMQDILAATDAVVAEPYLDSQRVGAIGASFGGYTVYWLMGNHQQRYRAMVSHCGVFNLESMYGSTEELFFVDWDLKGPYWSSSQTAELYRRFSPHRFAGNWQTPLLVIHGEKDFRVPVTQGMEAFTAAQVQGVPSRFLYFPNEGHWVMSPQNGVLWHRVFFDWLGAHLK
jgi:dipeptidyl aminopeptidase/acylaminoacyl peptidase